MDAAKALDFILLPGNSSEFEDSDVSDELDISQHHNDDLYIPESDMIELHEATSSDDDSDDNVPLSKLAEAEASCSTGKKLTKSQEHAKKYQWKKSTVTVPKNTFQGNFSDPPDEVYSPLTYFKHFIDDDCIRHCTEQTNIYAMVKSVLSVLMKWKGFSAFCCTWVSSHVHLIRCTGRTTHVLIQSLTLCPETALKQFYVICISMTIMKCQQEMILIMIHCSK